MYDWANSAYATTMIAAVLPIYYLEVAGQGLPGNMAENYWGYTQTVAMLLVAILSPVLGAVADMAGRKLFFLRLFAYAGVLSCFLFSFVGEGQYLLASALVVLGTLGFTGGNTFYDALLVDLVPRERRDFISSMGYTFGYIGGGVLLAVNLLMIEGWETIGFSSKTTATQAVFVSVGVWWLLFSLPIFRRNKDVRQVTGFTLRQYTAFGFGQITRTLRGIRRYPELLKYMISYWFFNDGISTIIMMATIYGAGIGIGTSHLILALLITQFVGIPFTILFGKLADWIGSKRSLYISLFIYVLVVILGYFMQTALHFYILAFVVGMVQGGSQSIARSIYSNLVPAKHSAEFFGFLSLSSKFSSIAGPFTFAIVGTLTGSSRLAILSLIVFFAVGIGMLTRVNLDKGVTEAAQA